MQQLFGRPVFEVDGVQYTWEDVALFAMLSGRWTPLDRAIREGLAAARHLEAAELDEPEEEIDAFAAEFRYDRELITAEETEAWLGERGLEVGDWMDWVRREVLRARFAPQAEELLRLHPAAPEEVAAVATADLLCSSRGNDLVQELARRAAAAAAREAAGEAPLPGSLPPGLVPRVLAYLPGADPARLMERLLQLAALDEALIRFQSTAGTPELIHKELEIGRLEWIRLDCRVLLFETEALAREAVLCVREDGMGVDEVAENAHALVYEMRFYLGELDPDLQPRLLAAAPQELIGPVPFEERQALFLVLDKLLPDEQAPELRREIERRAVARAVSDQVTRRVRWLEH